MYVSRLPTDLMDTLPLTTVIVFKRFVTLLNMCLSRCKLDITWLLDKIEVSRSVVTVSTTAIAIEAIVLLDENLFTLLRFSAVGMRME